MNANVNAENVHGRGQSGKFCIQQYSATKVGNQVWLWDNWLFFSSTAASIRQCLFKKYHTFPHNCYFRAKSHHCYVHVQLSPLKVHGDKSLIDLAYSTMRFLPTSEDASLPKTQYMGKLAVWAKKREENTELTRFFHYCFLHVAPQLSIRGSTLCITCQSTKIRFFNQGHSGTTMYTAKLTFSAWSIVYPALGVHRRNNVKLRDAIPHPTNTLDKKKKNLRMNIKLSAIIWITIEPIIDHHMGAVELHIFCSRACSWH